MVVLKIICFLGVVEVDIGLVVIKNVFIMIVLFNRWKSGDVK